MKKVKFDSEYFNIKDTLECGQVFRFKAHGKGFLCFSEDKCAYCYQENDWAVIECDKENTKYFENYFDLARDYSYIVKSATLEGVEKLTLSANRGKGIRILNQNTVEALVSFVVSQNNNIPRIKRIIERLCEGLGERKTFGQVEYFAFPSVKAMAQAPLSFYKSIGLGYRAEYIKGLAEKLDSGFDINRLKALNTNDLRKELIKIKGVGAKVADCALLFGFHRSDSFPVDTWIEKVYREDFKGTIKDRAKIAQYLADRFKENAGYYQQYLFHYKRMGEK